MKTTLSILLLITMLGIVKPGYSQNKFKPLIERIALLQVYIEHLQRGYHIAKTGLETVRKITKGEFDLHGDYFHSLEQVNPEIKKYAVIGSMISTQLRMVKVYKEANRYTKECKQFTPDEIEYLLRVFEHLLTDAANDIELLTLIITDHQLKMTDSDRMNRIHGLQVRMKNKETILHTFNAEMYGLAKARNSEHQELKKVQKFYQP